MELVKRLAKKPPKSVQINTKLLSSYDICKTIPSEQTTVFCLLFCIGSFSIYFKFLLITDLMKNRDACSPHTQ